jgi:hypothetical protein
MSDYETKKIGSVDLWREAYKYFCNQKINTKGYKVDRKNLRENSFKPSSGKVLNGD